MLNRMLENVVGLSRAEVCVVDLMRDTRPPSEIGQGFRSALVELKPTLMLVMGTFAVRALFGDEHAVSDARGAWTDLPYGSGSVAIRVTHHPEAILALAARGQAEPKREAFADLKEVGQRLT
jgi:uracil-DNA glycosylase family 4